MNEKIKIVRFHRSNGVAIVRGRDGKLQVAHVMNKRCRRLRNSSIISAVFNGKGKGEIR